MNRRLCAYCGVNLGRNRAKEHILRNSWLKELGHSKSQIVLDMSSSEAFLEKRNLVADQLQAGEICNECNGGWMNDRDLAVEEVVLGLARSKNLQEKSGRARDISLWIFKTGFTFCLTDYTYRRHVPPEIMANLKHGILPSAFVTFIHHAPLGERHVATSMADIWPEDGASFVFSEQKHRFKFGVQYDEIIFGCVYVTWPGAIFVLDPSIHSVIDISGAEFQFRDPIDEFALPEGIAETRLNSVLSSVGVRGPII